VPAVELVPPDLEPFADIEEAKAEAMIDDAIAMAALVAPCILDDDFAYPAAAKALLRAAVLRWNDAGTGAIQSESKTAGPFGHSQTIDTRQQRRNLFWPSEIESLQKMCQGSASGAFSIDTLPACTPVHADICSLNFGATYCSCGAVLTGSWPLYEV